ncbi:MAG: ACP S-malonyltransferase [Leptospirillia bacterium]
MKTAYLFPGQGSQSPGMLDRFDTADEQRLIDRASEILSADVRKISRNDPSGILDQTQWTQPLLLLCSVLALGRLEEDRPSVVLGHSLGEYSAYVAAGALTLDEALLLVHRRGEFMQKAVPAGTGLMAAVLGPSREEIDRVLAEVRAHTGGVVSVANDNCPGQCVIAGQKETVEKAIEALRTAGVRKIVPLAVSVPSHTALMSPAARAMKELLDQTLFKSLNAPVVANVTASFVGPGEASSEIRDLLVRQLESPVEWTKSMEKVLLSGVTRFVEIGSGSVLTGLGKRVERQMGPPEKITWVTTDPRVSKE